MAALKVNIELIVEVSEKDLAPIHPLDLPSCFFIKHKKGTNILELKPLSIVSKIKKFYIRPKYYIKTRSKIDKRYKNKNL